MRAYQTLRTVLHPLWPYCCPVCGDALPFSEWPLCLGCLARLPRVNADMRLPYVGAPGNMVTVRSWFVYNPESDFHRLIHDIKYHNRPHLARQLGREFALEKLVEGLQPDIIVPVPVHWTKLLLRGYNQTQRIALGISDITGVEVGSHLYAVRSHATQTMVARHERQTNVRGIFGIRNPRQLDGRHVAILDDVYTTGATLAETLRTILAASRPASVTFLTLGRTPSSH